MTTPNSPIKICYVIDNISFRGGERNFLQLALGLDRTHYEVHVICSPDGLFVERLTAADIPVYPVNMRNKWNLGAVWPMARYLQQHSIDVVHTQGRGDPFGRLAGRLAGVPHTISTVQMIVSRYWGADLGRAMLYSAIDKLTNPLVRHWIVVNGESRAVLHQTYRVPLENITVILNGIEPEQYIPSPAARTSWRERWHIKPNELVVGGIGKLTWQKGFEYLIRAWPQVRADIPQARLFILGEGELEQELKELVNNLGIADSCTFIGFETDIPAALAGIDIFAMPSMVEGLPMVLLEAMAAGKPAVASRITGSLDVVTDGKDALLVEPAQPDAIAQLLIQLLCNTDLRDRLGAAARQTVLDHFTVARVVQETEAVYQQLLNNQ